MAAGSNSNQNLRKAIGAIKDSTMVGMAKVNSEYKALDVAILKATNHVESLPKEKHLRTILGAVSGSRARVDVIYCIQALARRLAKTKTWIVALKTLIVIHRALREVDHSFCEELISYNHRRGHMLNLLHFKDESTPSAWDYSTWIRTYALYIDECLECFRVLKYDFYRDHSRTKKFNTPDLLDQLPILQQLLSRLLACQPYGSARYNFIIQYALSIVATESVRLYVSITDGVLNLVDKYFEMQKLDAVRALEIYRRAGEQAEKLSEFFEVCRTLEFGRRQKYVKIEQAPPSFLAAMEEYVKDAPQTLMLPWRPDDANVPVEIVDAEEGDPEDGPKQNSDTETNAEPAPLIPDLLSWDEPSQEPSLPNDNDPVSLILADASTEPAGWELALVTTTDAATQNKVNVLDRSTLDRLYDLALVPKPEPTTANHMPPAVSSNPFETDMYQEAYYPPSHMGPPDFMGEPYQAQYQQQGLIVGPDYMGEIPQHQAQYQQQGLVVGPDYMQLVATQHIAAQQYLQLEPPKSEVDYNQVTGTPQQQGSPLPPYQQQGSPLPPYQQQGSPLPPYQQQGSPLPTYQQQGSPLPPYQQQEQLVGNQHFMAQQYSQAEPGNIDVDYTQIAGIPQQQGPNTPPHQQQEQPDVGTEYMQMVVPAQNEQQQIELMVGHDSTQEVEIPKQQELMIVGQELESPFGNPFVIEGSLPNPPQTHTSSSSVTPDLSLI